MPEWVKLEQVLKVDRKMYKNSLYKAIDESISIY